ncbi:MAG: hypothetical protein ACRDPT_05670 [Streptomycetales bacterium]
MDADFELLKRSGIGGTIVANPDFRSLAAGATNFNDSTGKAWTVNSPAKGDEYTDTLSE